MKTPGPQAASFIVRDAAIGAGHENGLRTELRSGALVFVEVRERLGPSLYKISVGSRYLTASSQAFLEPGALLRARVERTAEGFVFRLLDTRSSSRDALDAVIAKLGLPVDEAARTALAALLGAGLSPDAGALSRVRRAALRSAGRDEDAGRVELAARMEAKGMAADEESLEALAAAGDGRGGSEHKGGSADQGGFDRRNKSPAPELPGEFDLEHDFERLMPSEEVPRILGRFIESLVRRAESGTDAESPSPAHAEAERLGLFNHLKSREGGWLLVPFRFDLDSVAFSGSLRIQLPYAQGGNGRIDLLFDAQCGDTVKKWYASLSYGGGSRPSLRISSPEDERALEAQYASLRNELAALGCTVVLGASRADGDVKGLYLDA